MTNRGDIKERVKRELGMVDTSNLFDDTTIEDAIWDAYLWVTDRHPFPKLEKAMYTSSVNGQDYYDNPSNFKSDSIFLIVINSQQYFPLEYNDFLRWKRENPNIADEYYFSQFANQYFLTPTPTAAGVQITVWGLIQPDAFVNDASLTIFSGSEDSINEGIMRKALSDLLGKDGTNELLKAQTIVDSGWVKINQRRGKYQRKDAPFFTPVDYFPQSNQASVIGNFRGR